MPTATRPRKTRKPAARVSPLIVRLDARSKKAIQDAARLRRVSVSDYVRLVTVPQAEREARGARDGTIVLTPDEQLAFWNALNEPVVLTPKQKELGALMRSSAMQDDAVITVRPRKKS